MKNRVRKTLMNWDILLEELQRVWCSKNVSKNNCEHLSTMRLLIAKNERKIFVVISLQIDLWGLVSISNLNLIFPEKVVVEAAIYLFSKATMAREKITFNRQRHLMISCIIVPLDFMSCLSGNTLIHFWYLFDCMMKLTSIWNPPSASVSLRIAHMATFFPSLLSRKHDFIVVVVPIGFAKCFLCHYKQIMIFEPVPVVGNCSKFRSIFCGTSFRNGAEEIMSLRHKSQQRNENKYVQ